ncbi:carbohydrate-binding family 9-like protein [Schumannella sp. 10F1B-5-1]|uniref:carbohydrate-binding family 9-like protein n=1 Tax=Schumannella sp. 10F1B-5-1 TaxID=2590780 RepID=UPI001130BE3E|nr:carbohydrate-binding family 9-like protein [Schumannella sp. 10F1B-5-1]TPW71566.1 polyhydroxyalkanoate depolymerase [Schumannella sp. 10F1B-5-1]
MSESTAPAEPAPDPAAGPTQTSERVAVAAPSPYTALRTAEAPVLDGRLASPCWRRAPRSPRFVDLVSGASTALDTRAAILWDDANLYVGAWLEQPSVTATLTERDAEIWHDDDVELFIAGPDGAGGRAYYELEVNAFGTIYEVLFAWGRERSPFGVDAPPELHADHELAREFPGVGYAHPRGPRTGFWGWDLPGLRTAVHVDGAINDPSVVDRGWNVEIAVPWASLGVVMGGDGGPDARLAPGHAPSPGDEWSIEVSRFNVARHGEGDSGGWSWSPHGVWDSHLPELFPRIRFSDDLV